MPLRQRIRSWWKRLKRRGQKSSKGTITTGTHATPMIIDPETRTRGPINEELPRNTAQSGSPHVEPYQTGQTLSYSAPSTRLADESSRRIDVENHRSNGQKSGSDIDEDEATTSQRGHVHTAQPDYEPADQPSLRSEKEGPNPLLAIDANGTTELDFGQGATTRTAKTVPSAPNAVGQPTPAPSLPPTAEGSIHRTESKNRSVLPYPSMLQTVQTLHDSVYPPKGDSTDNESLDKGKSHGDSLERLPSITVRSPTFTSEQEQHRHDPHRLNATSIRPMLGLSPSLAHGDAKKKSLSRSPAASITTTDMANDIFPREIYCILKLGFDDVMLWKKDLEDKFSIKWTEHKPYRDLLHKVDAHINKLKESHRDFRDHRTYMRYGTCQVQGDYHEQQVSILEDSQPLRDIAIRDICGFISQHNYESFHLEVFLRYSSVKVAATESINQPSLAEIIHDEVYRKQLQNFKSPHQWYVPRIDVNQLSCKDIIDRVIQEDRTLDLGIVDKTGFVSQVVQTAAKLFLVCIMQNHPMEYLWHLMDHHHFEDQNLPRECGCVMAGCPQRLRSIVQIQNGLFAHLFVSDQKFQQLGANVVLPIRYANENDKKKSFLGKGSAAEVYAVRIDPVHHNMSGDLDAEFALKIFKHWQVEGLLFEKELKMMKTLASYPNPNIVPFLTSWVQEGLFHILYPRASCSLYDYLGANGTNPPKITQRHAKWLLEQFRGLADAVRCIHDLGGPEDPPPRDVAPWTIRATKRNPRPDVNTIGCHYDINPRNVLVFERKPGMNPTFKLSDLGSGKFQTLGEGQESVPERGPRAQVTYMAPEAYADGASRPFDIWGLGCVFLELMGWFLMGTVPDQGEQFTEARQNHRRKTIGDEYDDYWSINGKEYVLNDAVNDRIDSLGIHHCTDLPEFNSVLAIIRNMFEIEPKLRPKAAAIYKDIAEAVTSMEESYSSSQHAEQESSNTSELTTEKAQASGKRSTVTNFGGANETTVADGNGIQYDNRQSTEDSGLFPILEKSTETTDQEVDTIDSHDNNKSAPRPGLQHELNQIVRLWGQKE